MRLLNCRRCGSAKPIRPTMVGRSFLCQCGLRNPVPRFVPHQPACEDERVTPDSVEPATTRQPEKHESVAREKPQAMSRVEVMAIEAEAKDVCDELRRAREQLKKCRVDIRERKAGLVELERLDEQRYTPAATKKFRALFALLGLVPGWIAADATIGVLGMFLFCPLSVKAFLKFADLVGIRAYRSRETLLGVLRQGELSESQLSHHLDRVSELSERHSLITTKANTARRNYENDIRRRADEVRIRREREEQLARTPKPIELRQTPKVDTSNARVLGKGVQWVYAYSFPSQMNGDIFPIKVGMTSRADVVKRIDEQLTGTSMPEPAQLLLLFRVNSASLAENALHTALKSNGRHMKEAVGIEWFKTNPEELVRLYHQIQP